MRHEVTYVAKAENTNYEICWCGATRIIRKVGYAGYRSPEDREWHACGLCCLFLRRHKHGELAQDVA